MNSPSPESAAFQILRKLADRASSPKADPDAWAAAKARVYARDLPALALSWVRVESHGMTLWSNAFKREARRRMGRLRVRGGKQVECYDLIRRTLPLYNVILKGEKDRRGQSHPSVIEFNIDCEPAAFRAVFEAAQEGGYDLHDAIVLNQDAIRRFVPGNARQRVERDLLIRYMDGANDLSAPALMKVRYHRTNRYYLRAQPNFHTMSKTMRYEAISRPGESLWEIDAQMCVLQIAEILRGEPTPWIQRAIEAPDEFRSKILKWLFPRAERHTEAQRAAVKRLVQAAVYGSQLDSKWTGCAVQDALAQVEPDYGKRQAIHARVRTCHDLKNLAAYGDRTRQNLMKALLKVQTIEELAKEAGLDPKMKRSTLERKIAGRKIQEIEATLVEEDMRSLDLKPTLMVHDGFYASGNRKPAFRKAPNLRYSIRKVRRAETAQVVSLDSVRQGETGLPPLKVTNMERQREEAERIVEIGEVQSPIEILAEMEGVA